MSCEKIFASIPLADSYLCANCDSIGNDSTRCHACGETVGLMSLARVIGTMESTAEPKAIAAPELAQ